MNEVPIKILLVEPEEGSLFAFTSYLEDEGCKVIAAQTRNDALDRFHGQRFDLIFIDVDAADLHEIVPQIVNESPNTPIVVLSSDATPEGIITAMRNGAWDFIGKPILSLKDLSDALNRNVEKMRQQHLSPFERISTTHVALQSLKQRVGELAQSSSNLPGSCSLNTFAQRLMSTFARYLSVQGGAFYLREHKGLRRMACLDPQHALEFIPFPLDPDSAFAHAIDQRKPLLFQDIRQFAHSSGFSGYSNPSALIYPLLYEGEVVALISLHSKTDGPLNEQDREIGALLALYAAESLRALRATETLRAAEANYREFFELSRVGMANTSRDQRFFAANPRMCEILGYERNSLLGRTWTSITHPDDLKDDTERFYKMRNGELTAYTIKKRFVRKDGRIIHALISARGIFSPSGEFDYAQLLLQELPE